MKGPPCELKTFPTLEKLRKRSRAPASCWEWMMILCTISIFGAILFPGGFRNRAEGQLTACKSNLKNIGTALEMYALDNQGHYPQNLTALAPNYLKTIPQCPAPDPKASYTLRLGKSAPGNAAGLDDYAYILCAAAIHREDWGPGRNYWAFSSKGLDRR